LWHRPDLSQLAESPSPEATGDVGDVTLEPESVAVKNQEALAALPGAEGPTAKVDAEFKRHVESGERAYAIEFSARQIMNRVAAAGD
jgi:hypothetical protein